MTELENLWAALLAECAEQQRSEITIPLLEAIWAAELGPDQSQELNDGIH
jgi:hypothetical protein